MVNAGGAGDINAEAEAEVDNTTREQLVPASAVLGCSCTGVAGLNSKHSVKCAVAVRAI